MNFTPKLNVEPVRGILTIAVVGLIVWAISVIPAPAPIAATHQVYAVQESPQWKWYLYSVCKRPGPGTINLYPPGIRISIGGKGMRPSSAEPPAAH
jgi:hypothetical protein